MKSTHILFLLLFMNPIMAIDSSGQDPKQNKNLALPAFLALVTTGLFATGTTFYLLEYLDGRGPLPSQKDLFNESIRRGKNILKETKNTFNEEITKDNYDIFVNQVRNAYKSKEGKQILSKYSFISHNGPFNYIIDYFESDYRGYTDYSAYRKHYYRSCHGVSTHVFDVAKYSTIATIMSFLASLI